MQIKAVLFIVVIGAVAVLAKKGSSSSSSEEDRNGYETFQVWPYGKPGRGPRPHKFKGPKHQIFVVGRPHYPQQPYYPQPPQYAPYPVEPQQPQQPGISTADVNLYLETVQKQMSDFSAKAYKEFQMVENELDRNKQIMEETMKSQFQTLEVALESKQSKEIEQAVKEGKDELKIQECVAAEENDFRVGMDADIQRTVDCLADATERARKLVNGARNTYTESSYMSSKESRAVAQKMRYCAERGDSPCVEDGINFINQKTKDTVEEGNLYFQNIQEVPRQQKIQMEYCRQNFMDDLRDMREAYGKMVKRCVIASEIQKPEEEDEEEKKEENGKPIGEVRPEVSVQA